MGTTVRGVGWGQDKQKFCSSQLAEAMIKELIQECNKVLEMWTSYCNHNSQTLAGQLPSVCVGKVQELQSIFTDSSFTV